MASALAIVASLISLIAGVWYNRDLFRGGVRPNLSSWAVWTFITLLWAGSFIFGATVVVLRWTGHPLELAYSIVGFFAYGGIGLLALRKTVLS